MKSAINWGPLKKLIEDKNVHEIIIDRADDSLYVIKNEIKKGPKLKQLELVKLAGQIMKHASNPKAYSAEVLITMNMLVHVVLPPLAPEGPFIRIWKIPHETFTFEHMIEWDVMSRFQADYIKNLLQTNQSLVLAATAGAGKMTLLKMMLDSLPKEYHLVTIEQYAELNLTRPRTVRLVAPHNKASELTDLVEIASRSRGDCLALANIHGPEIMPFLELLRDGHQGIMSTSGENVFEAIKRLEYKISAHAPWMTLDDIRLSITKAFGHIIFQARQPDGKRKLTHLARLEFSDGEIKLVPVKEKKS
jgi:Flp pilus assembly CpaF family ATPase